MSKGPCSSDFQIGLSAFRSGLRIIIKHFVNWSVTVQESRGENLSPLAEKIGHFVPVTI